MLFRYRCDLYLRRIAEGEGVKAGLVVPSEVLRGMATDVCAPLSRGCRATTISSTQGYWHQLSDTIENVWPAVVAQAATLMRRLVVRTDEDAER
jgi:hypothetical protein